ncbi:MAG: restriction endonuclease [Chloroflexi bacterium]|nr:restriction endonuclease [Chloroflexota bacterium]
MNINWQQKVEEYCQKYNIPILYLAEILYEPKVLPMIRGKAFEFTVMIGLQESLPKNEWIVSKATMRGETSFHDTDIRVFHKRTGKVIRLECKLAKKEGYRLFPAGHSEIRVKCMRSRTLGVAKVKEVAPKLGVSEESLSVHNDQYVPADFDIVVSSIGNAFYRTDKKTGLYEWEPTKTEEGFIQKLRVSSEEDLRDFAFRTIYIARTQDLAARSNTGIVCSRKGCKNKTNCGFVPNYPVIRFDAKTNKPTSPWVLIEESVNLFRRLLTS